jgi:hypothetical protein
VWQRVSSERCKIAAAVAAQKSRFGYRHKCGSEPARWERRRWEHSGQLAICLLTPSANREREWNMSDPRYTDRNDQSRRFGVQGSDGAGKFWPWIASALTALGFLVGLLIGYNWGADHERRAQLSPPTTTGLAPSHQRPAPPANFGDMPAPPSAPKQSPR